MAEMKQLPATCTSLIFQEKYGTLSRKHKRHACLVEMTRTKTTRKQRDKLTGQDVAKETPESPAAPRIHTWSRELPNLDCDLVKRRESKQLGNK